MPLVYGGEQYVISGIPLPPTKTEGDVVAGSLFQLLTNSAFQFQRRTAAKINAFVRVNVADARRVSSVAALSGNSEVCSYILKF